ncbi:hypothetical protein ABGV40_15085 [Paenibacillus amylolyticus]|uniref:hypothetical protein n=1 Tax=Paenibacillus amylolyticus TaxID=1451 RepID=UPI003241D0CF
MKLKVAPRKLKKNCIYCNCSFKKGDPYWKWRQVYKDDYIGNGKLLSWTENVCHRCKYKEEDRERRSRNLQERCQHPEHMIEIQYSYIPGEAVMHPDHYECRICRKWV